MDWDNFLSALLSAGDEAAHIECDEHGLTVLADLDGDGVPDRLSRMEFEGQSITVDLEGWGMKCEVNPSPETPEWGCVTEGGTQHSPGWGEL